MLCALVVKDASCMRYVYSGRRCYHGNVLFADVIGVVVYINDINNS